MRIFAGIESVENEPILFLFHPEVKLGGDTGLGPPALSAHPWAAKVFLHKVQG